MWVGWLPQLKFLLSRGSALLRVHTPVYTKQCSYHLIKETKTLFNQPYCLLLFNEYLYNK